MGEKQELITKEAQRAMAARSPFAEMERMMDRMFEGFFPERGWAPGGWSAAGTGAQEARLARVDVVERAEDIVVRAELPGVDKREIEVSVTDATLSIRATPRPVAEEGEYHCCEIGGAPFARDVRLPVEVDGEKATAVFRDGLLELHLPKTERARRRAIRVE